MKITILSSSEKHPIYKCLLEWVDKYSHIHDIKLVRKKDDLEGGDILFLISCLEIVKSDHRTKYSKTLVIHASNLPCGRGWSPHVWQIIEGKTEITVTLLEAADQVDAGDIWCQKIISIPKDALYEEINSTLFNAEIELMDFAVENLYHIKPIPQCNLGRSNYYPKRSPKDSEIDCKKSISEQFDLIRVCDPQRFPAHFTLNGHTYKITLEKMPNE